MISSGRRFAPGETCGGRLKDDDIEIGATECGACRIQMEQGCDQAHPAPDQARSPGLWSEPVTPAALQGTQATSRDVLMLGVIHAPVPDRAPVRKALAP